MTSGDDSTPGNPDEGVSTRAAKQLRDAMERLLAGRPQRTDGRLIKDNLWKEAQVSRATMNRATRVLADWDSKIAACDGFTPREARKNDQLAKLRTALDARTRECTELRRQLDAAATAIAALHHDNTLLRQELNRGGTLASMDAHRHPLTSLTLDHQSENPMRHTDSGDQIERERTAATAIAALHHDNTLLRQELDHAGHVIPLNGRREP